jgi:hypothetical protein
MRERRGEGNYLPFAATISNVEKRAKEKNKPVLRR